MIPRYVVLGTGRSGTHSIVDYAEQHGLEAEHEPHSDIVPLLASSYAHGVITQPGLIMQVLEERDWPELVADFALTPLVSVLMEAWPDTQFAFVTRHPASTSQ